MNKKCKKCEVEKPLDQYYKHPQGALGRETMCKTCRKARRAQRYQETKSDCAEWAKGYYENNKSDYKARKAKRRAAKLQRTPAWSETREIAWFYEHCPEGMEVDHKHPLQGKTVSGLHCFANLQYLAMSDNRSKSNK
jgi:hypothetical protein